MTLESESADVLPEGAEAVVMQAESAVVVKPTGLPWLYLSQLTVFLSFADAFILVWKLSAYKEHTGAFVTEYEAALAHLAPIAVIMVGFLGYLWSHEPSGTHVRCAKPFGNGYLWVTVVLTGFSGAYLFTLPFQVRRLSEHSGGELTSGILTAEFFISLMVISSAVTLMCRALNSRPRPIASPALG